MPDIKKHAFNRAGRRLTVIHGGKATGHGYIAAAPKAGVAEETDRKLMERIFAGYAWHG